MEDCLLIKKKKKAGKRMYEMNIRVTYSQVGCDLKSNMSGIVDFFQDCAIFHSESVGRGFADIALRCRAWFLSSWQIIVERYPEFGEKITIRTWPHHFKGMYGYRNFDIVDAAGNEIVKANSIWIFMDTEHLRLIKPENEDLESYELEKALEMVYEPRKIKLFDEIYQVCLTPEQQMPLFVRDSFLDSNRHVNNGRYVEEALNYIPSNYLIKEMRVDYRKAAMLGDEMYPSVFEKDNYRQVVFSDKDGKPFVIIEFLC